VRPPESHLDLLTRPLFAAWVTVRDSGAPQANPMWFVWDDEAEVVKLTHTKERHNYRYVQREPRVALLIMDPDHPYRYLQLRGVVDRIEDDPTGAFYQQLQLRYRGRTSPPKDADVRVIVTIKPTAFVTRN
jgi:PPOX class probable F420-dependent enzyme